MLVDLGLELELRSDVMAEDILQVGLFSHALRSEVQDVSHLIFVSSRLVAVHFVSLRFVPLHCVFFSFIVFRSVSLRFVSFCSGSFHLVWLYLNTVGLLVGQMILQSVGRDTIWDFVKYAGAILQKPKKS